MDQGNDAIKAREIWVSHRPVLLGPETSIFGLYAGPLWYYFIASGYLFTAGHPAGPIILLIGLNTLLTLLIIFKIAKEVSPKVGLLAGTLLQISWWFYDSSRYAFNPFPDTFLGFMTIFCLVDFLKGERKKYFWAAIFFGLFFHTDLASAVAVNIFFFGFGMYCLLAKRLKVKDFFLGNLLIILFLAPHLISELINGFPQLHILWRQFTDSGGVFSGNQFGRIGYSLFLVVSKSIFRQIPELGFLGFVVVVYYLYKRQYLGTANKFIKDFVFLTIILLLTCWFFFATNLGWRDWQTSFLSPLIFVSVILALTEVPLTLFVIILSLMVSSHLLIFKDRYGQYLGSTNDPSILANEIKAIDWVYSQAKDGGYSVYVWIPSVYDYHYQYLFWWYGRKKYGYLPCEMNTFPGSPKTYLPIGFERYEKPKGNCPSKVRLLIMEPDKNDQIDQAWYGEITQGASKVAETKVGKLRLEKLIINPKN